MPVHGCSCLPRMEQSGRLFVMYGHRPPFPLKSNGGRDGAHRHFFPSARRRRRHRAEALDEARARWRAAFRRVRGETEARAAHLSAEDQIVQSMADASPTKWHRAHVTWFFEQFLLVPNAPGYTIFDERFPFLFNSYYVAAGPRHARPQRGLITRPNGADVSRLSRPCRCRGRKADRDRAGGEGRRGVQDPGDRPASRTAAPGIADHRHPARLRAEPDRSGLRCELAAAARGARTARLCRSAGRHSAGRP